MYGATLFREVLVDRDTCTEWLENKRLIPTYKLCREGHLMKLYPDHGMGVYRCQKKHKTGGNQCISRSKGTFFEAMNLTPERAVMMIYSYAIDLSYEDCKIQTSTMPGKKTGQATVAKWYCYCRDLVNSYVTRRDVTQPIGGPGHIVKIDEILFDRRKRSRTGQLRPGTWVLGMADRKTKEVRLMRCPGNDRTPSTLLPMILERVAPGTTIQSDQWTSYKDLMATGEYPHGATKFVSPPLSDPPVQSVDGTFSDLRKKINRGQVCHDDFPERLCEYSWRRSCKKDNLDPFQDFLDIIRNHYPMPDVKNEPEK